MAVATGEYALAALLSLRGRRHQNQAEPAIAA
jgi:hypothetical protein